MRHRPALWWLAALVLAATTTFVIDDLLDDAERARAAWTDRQDALVATTTIAIHDPIGSHNTERRELPAGMIPEEAIVDLVPGSSATSAVYPGEVLVDERVLEPGEGPAGNALATDTSAVAIPLGAVADLVGPGDRVDIWVSFEPFLVPDQEPTRVVARSAVIVETVDDIALVAVRDEDIAATTGAISHGIVTVAIVGRPG
ncbi:MAG: hypothetical protein OEU32_06680 [Acidimicrobiia bacterium]|nr:hypothetical protein [Acidimicrobiia bacterium]